MKIFKEDIDNIKKVDQINGDMPVVMADAKIDSQKNDKEADKRIETDLKKLANQKAFLGAKNQPVPDEPQMAKINLDESLFEDFTVFNESVSIESIKKALKASGMAAKTAGKWLLDNLDTVIIVFDKIGVSSEAISALLKDINSIVHPETQDSETEPEMQNSESTPKTTYKAKVRPKVATESMKLDEAFISVAAITAALKACAAGATVAGKWLIANLDTVISVLTTIGVSAEVIKLLIDSIYKTTNEDSTDSDSKSTINDSLNLHMFEAAPVAPKEHGLTDRRGNYYSDDDRSRGADKKMKKDLWTIVYDELCPVSINVMNKTKFPNARLSDRYGATGRCYSDGEKITVYAKDEAGLRHAYDVADYYGIECTLPKKEFFKDPDKQVSCTLTVPVEGDY